MVGLDFTEFGNNGCVVARETTNLRQGPGGLFGVTFADQETRGFWEDEHSNNEDNGPGKLHGDGNAVGTRVVSVLSGVVYDGCEEKSNSDGELVGSDDNTSDPFGCSFRLV